MKRFTDYLDSLQTDEKKSAKYFWGFYLIFFILVFLMIFFGRRNYTNTEYEYGEVEEELVMRLNKNYLFDYKVYLDNQLFDYYGKKDQDVELFKYNNYDYYFNKSFYIKKDNWEETDNPYKFYEFLNYDNYKTIIKNGYYEKREILNNGNTLWYYEISGNTLNKLLFKKNTDFEEEANEIIIELDDKNTTKKITMNLDSYCLKNELCEKSLKIELEFDMMDEIKEIDNPME